MSRNFPEFGGALCPLVTPFIDGGVDERGLETLVEHLVTAGIDGLVPCGTTGEFASLSTVEYRTVLKTTVEAAAGRVPVMAGTAATSRAGVEENTALAAEVGVDAALVTLPYFHTANDPAGNEAFLTGVADDATLPVYLYNIPSCAGAIIDPETVTALADHESVVGLKDSGGDLSYALEVVERTPAGFECYLGVDDLVLWGLLGGATGGVNALSNVVPEAFVELVAAVEGGDIDRARDLQRRIATLFRQCSIHGFAPATKAALVARGVFDEASVRPPLVGVDDAAREVIGTGVKDILAAVETV